MDVSLQGKVEENNAVSRMCIDILCCLASIGEMAMVFSFFSLKYHCCLDVSDSDAFVQNPRLHDEHDLLFVYVLFCVNLCLILLTVTD